MATKSYPFQTELAIRLANIHKPLLQDIFDKVGISYPNYWEQKFEAPAKPRFIEDCVSRASMSQTEQIAGLLPEAEKRTQAYETKKRNGTMRGKPMDNWIRGPYVAPVNNRAANIPVSNDVPVPDEANTETAQDTETQPDDTATVVNKIVLEFDEDKVRQIAKDEAAKLWVGFNKPTVVNVTRTDASGETVVIDMGIQHYQFPKLCELAKIRNRDGYVFPVWIPGPAGSGKTTGARNLARAFSLPFYFNGAIDTEYKLLGFIDAGGKYHRTAFREAYENGGVYLWDEVDASNPAALVAMNAAIENGICTFADATVSMHKDCIVLAAANTFGTGATHEYVGRNKIDAATVDRFIMLEWGYDEALEFAISANREWTMAVQRIRKAVKDAGIKHIVSPRASIRGGEMLASGMAYADVLNMVVRKGLSDDQWNNIKRTANV